MSRYLKVCATSRAAILFLLEKFGRTRHSVRAAVLVNPPRRAEDCALPTRRWPVVQPPHYAARVGLPIRKKPNRHLFPKGGGIIELERIFKLRWCAVGFPELCVSILIFEHCEHPCRKMIENVTVIGPHAWVVGIEANLDCRFGWNKDGVALCAGNFLPVDLGNFEDMAMQMHGI